MACTYDLRAGHMPVALRQARELHHEGPRGRLPTRDPLPGAPGAPPPGEQHLRGRARRAAGAPGRHLADAERLETESVRVRSSWIFPGDLGTPLLRIDDLFESNPLKPI